MFYYLSEVVMSIAPFLSTGMEALTPKHCDERFKALLIKVTVSWAWKASSHCHGHKQSASASQLMLVWSALDFSALPLL